MRNRLTKSLIAMLVLVAMLTQNAYSVYAVSVSDDIQVEHVSEQPEIVVETESEEVTQTEEYTDSQSEYDQTSSDVNYDDQVMTSEEGTNTDSTHVVDDTVITDDTVVVDDTAVDEDLPEEDVAESLDIFDTQISGSGYDSIEILIDTNRLNAGDTFRIDFTGPDFARYDTRLNDVLDATAHGIYRFVDLDKEGFNIRANSSDDVTFEFTSEDGMPVIKVISLDSNVEKNLYTKSVTARDGRNVAALFGEGYSSAVFTIDTKELAPKAEFSVYVDTEADALINGVSDSFISCTKETKTIELSNLDKEQFIIYVVGNEGFDITSSAVVDSVEDGEATFYVSGDAERNKRVYTYSDSEVTVTATLQFADAVPDDAEFVVTPIRNERAVDAYLGALNNSAEETEYTEENTLLYDIAFLVDKTDDEGNVIPGEKVDFEPESGSVKIDIRFNRSQLTDEIGASDDEDIEVNHLPLKDYILDNVDTAAEATNISANDVIVEPINADAEVVEGGTDEVTFTTDSFTTYAFTSTQKNYFTPGASASAASVLGNAVNFGLVANSVTIDSDVETNIATYDLSGYGPWNAPENNHGNGGISYISEYTGSGFGGIENNGGSGMKIYTPLASAARFGDPNNVRVYVYDSNGQVQYRNNESRYANSPIARVDNSRSTYTLDTSMSKNDIDSKVKALLATPSTNSGTLFSDNNAFDYSKYSPKSGEENVLDITNGGKNYQAGTYYVDFDSNEEFQKVSKIRLADNQNVVLNIKASTLDIKNEYHLQVVNRSNGSYASYQMNGYCYGSDNNYKDELMDKVIFNSNASTVTISKSADGVFVFPNAKFTSKAVSSGWVVANSILITGSEWHFKNKNIPRPDSKSADFLIGIKKKLEGNNLSAADYNQEFAFYLYETDATMKRANSKPQKDTPIAKIEHVKGDEREWFFPSINYKDLDFGTANALKFYYVIQEYMTDEQKENWSAGQYAYAHIIVTVDKNYNVSAEYIYNSFTGDSQRPNNNGGNFPAGIEGKASLQSGSPILFINSKPNQLEKEVSLPIKKSFVGDQNTSLANKNFEFTITSLTDGFYVKPHTFNEVNDFKPNNTVSIKGAGTGAFSSVTLKYNMDRNTDQHYIENGREVSYKVYGYKIEEKHPDNCTRVTKKFGNETREFYYDSTTGIYYDASVYIVKLFSDSVLVGTLKDIEHHFNGKRYYYDEKLKTYVTADDKRTPIANDEGGCGPVDEGIEFINGYEAPKGKIIVKKVTNGAFESGKEFYFEIERDGDRNGDNKWYRLKNNGSGELDTNWSDYKSHVFTIHDNETIEINNVPAGYYNIYEYSQIGEEWNSDYRVPTNESSIEASVLGYYVSYSGGELDPKGTGIYINNGSTVTKIMTNTKDIDSDSIEISGIKSVDLSSYNIENGEFKFTLTANPTTAPMPENATAAEKAAGVMTVSNTGNAFTFGTIEYTKDDIDKTYTYTVRESVSGDNFAVNQEVYTVTVVVTQDGSKVKPTVSIKKGTVDATEIKFNNIYNSEKPLAFAATKSITGRNMNAEEFEFILEAKNDNAFGKMPTGAVTKDGKKYVSGKNPAGNTTSASVEFGGITFTKEDITKGDFEYEIRELGTDGDGLVYDKTVYNITVTPKVGANKTLELEKVITKTVGDSTTAANSIISGDKITAPFNNIYCKGDIVLQFTKEVEGDMPEGTTFTFNLYKYVDGINDILIASNPLTADTYPATVVFDRNMLRDELKFNPSSVGNTYRYYCIEDKAGTTENGIEYSSVRHDFTVKVIGDTDNDGALEFEVKNADTVIESNSGVYNIGSFTNKYSVTSAKVKIPGVKSLSGKAIEAGQYSFTIAAAAAEGCENADIDIPVDDIPMPDPATTSVKNADGEFEFGEIEFTKAGEYHYIVTEDTTDKVPSVRYDENKYEVVIKIKDNGQGGLEQDGKTIVKRSGNVIDSLTFVNTYVPDGVAKIEATKVLNDGLVPVRDGMFVFGLYTDTNGTKLYKKNSDGTLSDTPYTAVNANGGHVEFDDITYSLDDIDPQTHIATFTYYIHELSSEDELTEYYGVETKPLAGFKYDDKYYPVTVTVTDDGTTELKTSVDYSANEGNAVVISNPYEPKGSTEIFVKKKFQGFDKRALTADDTFTFTLTALSADDPNVPEKTSESAEQILTVDSVTINGTMIRNNEAAFAFKTLNYTKAGTYKYEVREVVEESDTIVYDSHVETVIVTVTDNQLQNGELVCVPDVGIDEDSPITFTNKVPEGAGVYLNASKMLSGKDLVENDFTFNVKEINEDGSDKDKGVSQSKGNNAPGSDGVAQVNFDLISYEMKDTGRHVYKITESIPRRATDLQIIDEFGQAVDMKVFKGVAYDPSNYYAVVDVSVSATGDKLEVSGPTYYKEASNGNSVDGVPGNVVVVDKVNVKFINKFSGETSVKIGGIKRLYRDEVKAGNKIDIPEGMSFTFELRDADGNVLTDKNGTPYRTSNVGEKFEFAEIKYTTEDLNREHKIGPNRYMYVYSVVEKSDSSKPYIEYDENTIYDVAVYLSVDNRGNLTAEKKVIERATGEQTKQTIWDYLKTLIEGNPDGIVFNNVYNAKGKIRLGVTKTLTGMSWSEGLKFKFTMTEGANIIERLLNLNGVDTVDVDADEQTKYFNDITYTLEDLYKGSHHGEVTDTFVIKEAEVDEKDRIPGMTYSAENYTVVVTATDMHDGTIRVTASINGGDPIVSTPETDEASDDYGIMVCKPEVLPFINSYIPDKTTVDIDGLKVLTGRTLEKDEFAFTIKAVTAGAPMPEVTRTTCAADGTFKFGPIEIRPEHVQNDRGVYESEKKFEYIISEDLTGAIYNEETDTYTKDGVTYDAEEKRVIVTVKNAGGKLSAEAECENDSGLQFTNSFDAKDSTTLSVKKQVGGTSSTDKKFTFNLKSLTELDSNRAGGKQTADGFIIDTVEAANGETVPFKVLNYSLQKTLSDAKAQGNDEKTAVYEYEITEVDPNAGNTDVKDGYTYSKQVYTATVTVKANDDGTLTISKEVKEVVNVKGEENSTPVVKKDWLSVFDNTYYADGSTTIQLVKTLKGRDIKDGEFTFLLKDENGKTLEDVPSEAAVMSKDKEATNTFTFGEKAFNYTIETLENGGTYADHVIKYYTIVEDIPNDAKAVLDDNNKIIGYKLNGVTYENATYAVAVFIENKHDGNLKVTPVYARFQSDSANAIISMKELVNSKMDYTTKSFSKMVEDLAKDSAFAKNAEFVNVYEAENSWDPTGKKVLTGKPLDRSRMFEFVLDEIDNEVDGNIIKVDGKLRQGFGYNAGEGNQYVVFDESTIEFLHYTLDDVGSHVYRITEKIPVKDDDPYNGSVEYDERKFYFHVNVSDAGDGTLNVVCAEDSTDTGHVYFTFNNKYHATGYIDLFGTKTLEGANYKDVNPFTFGIAEVIDGKVGTEYIAENDGATIKFDHTKIPILNYSIDTDAEDPRAVIGDHKYIIREVNKTAPNIKYDDTEYTVTVTVTDDGLGTLKADVTNVTYPLNDGTGYVVYDFAKDNSHSFSFKNEYKAGAELQFIGTKHLVDPNAAGAATTIDMTDMFRFSVYQYSSPEERASGFNRKNIATTTSDSSGNYVLGGPAFTQEDLKTVDINTGETVYADAADFYYQIVEVKPSLGTWDGDVFTGNDGITYDNTVYNIDVTVRMPADKTSNKLSVTVVDHDKKNTIPAVNDSTNVYKVGGSNYFDFTNTRPEYTRISGTKTWNDGGVAPASRPDVYIDLRSSVDNYTSVIDTYVIKAPATSYSFERLPIRDGRGNVITYRVSERPIAGYHSEQIGYDFINTKGDIIIRKIDAETRLPLEGAVLAILDSAGTEVERWTTTSAPHAVAARLTAGATYTLHEVSAPTGYRVAPDQTFRAPATGGETVVTMEDPRIVGRVRLRKLDADTREALSGAEFALYTEDGRRVYASGAAGSYTYSSASSNGRFAVNAAGELLISEIPYGTYYFSEIVAPSGYALSSERIGFTVLEDGATYDVTCLDPKERGSVRLRKTNASGTVSLSGAVFELYARTPSTISSAIASTIYGGSYYRVGTYTTDASGMIYVGDLPWDDYYFLEVSAPTGYELSTDVSGDSIVYPFTIGAGTRAASVAYDLGRVTNSTSGGGGGGGGTAGARTGGRISGGVVPSVLGVRAAPKQGVLGERIGPVTGDSASIILWMLLLIFSIVAIVTVTVVNVKRRLNRRRIR